MSDTILILLLCCLVWLLGFNFGKSIGTEQGRIQIASGQYVCELNSNKDQTTDWSCRENTEVKQ